MRLRMWIFMAAVGLCGCWKVPMVKVTPGEATDEEIKHVISELPEGFRAAQPDTSPVSAKKLDLHVWAFDFDGGPFNMVIETIGGEPSDRLNYREPRLHIDGERGRLLIWLQPRESPKMAAELREKFHSNKPQVPNLSFGIEANGRLATRADNYGKLNEPVVPLWFGWKDADVKASLTPVALKVREVASVLRIEACEKGVPSPRKIIVSFQAAGE